MTKCTIWIRNESKQGHGIYVGVRCDRLGEISGVGLMLFTHYKTEEKIRHMLSLGFIDILDSGYDKIIAYNRNLGEPTQLYITDVEYEMTHRYAQEFNYLYNDGWFVNYNAIDNKFIPITEAFENERICYEC